MSGQSNPAVERIDHSTNPKNPSAGEPGADAFPFVLSTYRLTEHHTAGGMSRTVGRLSALQPELFCEVSPELARLRGLDHGGWATIVTSRSAIEARVLVTRRMAPLQVRGQTVHQVGLPFHWGRRGLTVGDSANDLLGLALDPNVHIQDTKSLTCDVRPGRRPRGAALRALVERYRGEPRDDDTRADGLLHRHVRVHRVQGVRGGVQGVEPGPRARPSAQRSVVRQHAAARRRHGPLDELRERAAARVEALRAGGVQEAHLYGNSPDDGVGGTAAFFLLLDAPEVYGLPPDPVVPTRSVLGTWTRAALASVALIATAAGAALLGRR